MEYKVYYKEIYVGTIDSNQKDKTEFEEGDVYSRIEIIVKGYEVRSGCKECQYRVNRVKDNSIWIDRLDNFIRKQRAKKLHQLGI